VHLIHSGPASESRARCTGAYDPKGSELLLGTDAVDVVVKATAARAGQIAPATENSVAEPAPSTAETSAGSFFQSTEGMRQLQQMEEFVEHTAFGRP
jgi:hypothetical protein